MVPPKSRQILVTSALSLESYFSIM